MILLYRCHTMTKWEYLGPLVTGGSGVAQEWAPAQIWECPQLFEVDGQWILMLSLVEPRRPRTGPGHLPDGRAQRGRRRAEIPAHGRRPDRRRPRLLRAPGGGRDGRRAAHAHVGLELGEVQARRRHPRLGLGRGADLCEGAVLPRRALLRSRWPRWTPACGRSSTGAGSFSGPAPRRAFEVLAAVPPNWSWWTAAEKGWWRPSRPGRILVDGSPHGNLCGRGPGPHVRAYPTATSHFEVRGSGTVTVHALALLGGFALSSRGAPPPSRA